MAAVGENPREVFGSETTGVEVIALGGNLGQEARQHARSVGVTEQPLVERGTERGLAVARNLCGACVGILRQEILLHLVGERVVLLHIVGFPEKLGGFGHDARIDHVVAGVRHCLGVVSPGITQSPSHPVGFAAR